MFLEQSSTNYMNFVQIADSDWLRWQPKSYIFEKKKKKKKTIQKSSSQKP